MRINGCSINGHKVCLHVMLMKAWGPVCPPSYKPTEMKEGNDPWEMRNLSGF